jgi:hypothetical protein
MWAACSRARRPARARGGGGDPRRPRGGLGGIELARAAAGADAKLVDLHGATVFDAGTVTV